MCPLFICHSCFSYHSHRHSLVTHPPTRSAFLVYLNPAGLLHTSSGLSSQYSYPRFLVAQSFQHIAVATDQVLTSLVTYRWYDHPNLFIPNISSTCFSRKVEKGLKSVVFSRPKNTWHSTLHLTSIITDFWLGYSSLFQ